MMIFWHQCRAFVRFLQWANKLSYCFLIALYIYYIRFLCYRNRYDDFDAPRKLSGDPNHPANDLSSPESIQSVERPPLRYVDMYIMPEIPGITKRNTVALLSCMGFIIMFGMRTIMGIVKLEIKVSFYFVKVLVSYI